MLSKLLKIHEVSLLILCYVTEKTPDQQQEFFSFYAVYVITKLVNIKRITGTIKDQEL